MSDTPIAEQLAAALNMPWLLRRSWRMQGHLYGADQGESMSEPTPEQLKQMRDGAAQLRDQGEDVRGIEAVIDLVTGVDPGPQ